MGRTRVLPIRPALHDARNLPAPIISVIIGLPLPVFATACILLPVACPPLQPARRSACSACSACSARSARSACSARSTCSARSACSACSAAPASQPARRLLGLLCHLPAVLPVLPVLPILPALPAARRLPVTCLLCRSSPPACKKKRDFPKSRFFIIRFGPSSAPPRLSARQSRKPSRTSCSRILAQSATGCFSPSTNRIGHPRLQSSM